MMPVELPESWRDRIVKPVAPVVKPTSTPSTTGGSAYGRKGEDEELTKVRTAPEGDRNNQLFRSSANLAELCAGGEIGDCRDSLVAAAMAAGLPEGEARKTAESGWRAGIAQPRTAPAGKTAIIAITAAATPDSENWGEPQPLVAEHAREVYPVSALPKVIAEAVGEVQSFVQAPVEMVAMAALGAASTAIQALVNVERTEGLTGPVSLFALVLAPSGERKSTLDGRFSAPIRKFELDEAERLRPQIDAFRADLASWEAQKRGVLSRIEKAAKDGKSTTEDKERLRALEEDQPKPPRVPTITHQDSTMEALAYSLATSWPSACLQSSEAGSVFGGHAMGKDTLMRTLSFYDSMWDASSFRVSRRTAGGSYWIQSARLTLSLQVQPGVFDDFLSSDRGLSRNVGFLSRILLAAPESTQGRRKFKEAPSSWPALTRFNERTSELLAMPVHVDDDGGLEVTTLRLAPAAKTVWIAFHDRIEAELVTGGSLVDVRDVAAKTADNAVRLAAIFQVFEHGIGTVGLPAFESGARIAEWHLHESRRVFGLLAQPEENAMAAKLDTWLLDYSKAHHVTTVPVSAVQKAGPGKLRSKATLGSAISELEALDRVRLIKGPGKARTIEINPALLAAAVIAVPAVIAQPPKKAVV